MMIYKVRWLGFIKIWLRGLNNRINGRKKKYMERYVDKILEVLCGLIN